MVQRGDRTFSLYLEKTINTSEQTVELKAMCRKQSQLPTNTVGKKGSRSMVLNQRQQ